MKIYVASSWRNGFQPGVVGWLRAFGHSVYDFREPGAEGPDGTSPLPDGFSWSDIDSQWQEWPAEKYREALEDPLAERGFAADMAALNWADATVLVQPCGTSSHLELGYAVGKGQATAVFFPVGVHVEPELMVKMADRILVGLDELESWVQSHV